jgi:tetratricopeptide (TPR) repeat protein
VLTEQFAETVETQPELVAHHYTEAGLSERAIPYWRRAGERAVQLPAYAEAVRFYQLALQMLERQESQDEAQRCVLLLALGEAQWKAGEYLATQETLLHAADNARALRATELLVRAALVLGMLTVQVGLAPAPAVRLLEEALRGLGAEDNPLTAKTFGGLARTLRYTGEQHQALVYAQQAVAMARRLGDPELLAANLYGMLVVLQGPEHAQQRLTYATEMLQLAKATNAKEELIEALYWRWHCLLELGDMPATDEAIDAYARIAEERQPPSNYALLQGFGPCGLDAAARRQRTSGPGSPHPGQRLQTENATGILACRCLPYAA